MEETRVLMVVNEPEARLAYEEKLSGTGVACRTVASFKELLQLTVEGAYSGLLIDVPTLIRSSKEEKSIAYECINFYPTLRMKWDPRLKNVSFSPQEHGGATDTQGALAHFIEKRCRAFAARSLRRFNRKDTYLSLILHERSDCDATYSLKTFTVNLSQGGAFVHCCDPRPKGARVLLGLVGLPGPDPLPAKVCWSIPWGGSRCIPGIGVMFDPVGAPQGEWIAGVLGGQQLK